MATRQVSANVRGFLDIASFINSVDDLTDSLKDAEATIAEVEIDLDEASGSIEETGPAARRDGRLRCNAIPGHLDQSIAEVKSSAARVGQQVWLWRLAMSRPAAQRCSSCWSLIGRSAAHGSRHRGAEADSAVVLAVEIANATGQRCQQLVRHRRHVVEHRHEVALAEQQQRAIGFADHRRSARPVVEQRQLADDGAGAERRDLLAVALDHHRTLEHDERFAACLSLIDDQRAGGHDNFVAGLGDLFEVLLRTRREQRNLTKMVEVRLFAGHCGRV